MRYLLLLLVPVFIHCDPPTPPESRGDKLAKGLCGCTEQLISLNQEAEKAPDSLAFRKISLEFEKAHACATGLGIQSGDQAALELALNRLCPALAAHKDLLPELLRQ